MKYWWTQFVGELYRRWCCSPYGSLVWCDVEIYDIFVQYKVCMVHIQNSPLWSIFEW